MKKNFFSGKTAPPQLPAKMSDYIALARLDRPIGIWLLFWPCLWGLALAGATLTNWAETLPLTALFGVGASLMRAAGCVWNDITDRHIDKKIARTRTRPLATGRITVPQALFFMALLCLAGLWVLLQFNRPTIITGLFSIILVALYPFMKRITWWPQLFLGMTFNWGALLGWTAISGQLAIPALLLWIAGIFWTLGYDTIYAGQDYEDDKKTGIKSSFRRLKPKARKPFLYGCYSFFILFISLAVIAQGGKLPAFFGFIALLWLVTLKLVKDTNLDNPESCLASFKFNHAIGFAVALTLFIPSP